MTTESLSEATSESMRWFQASGNGNGIGLTVLSRPDPTSDASSSLSIYVLPKFWRQDIRETPFSEVLVLPDATLTAGQAAICVFEQDVLGMPAALAPSMRLRGGLGEAGFAAEGAPSADSHQSNLPSPTDFEDGAGDPLWQEVLAPRSFPAIAAAPSAEVVSGFWNLIRDEVRPIFNSPNAGALLSLDDPSARRFFIEHFLSWTRQQVARRRPLFAAIQDPLPAVRGRILVPELIQRTAHRRLPIWCEYDSLSSDTLMWQAIRRAVMICAQEVEDCLSVLEVALDCDASLGDVSVSSVADCLAQESSVGPGIRDQHLLSLYQSALAIIREDTLLALPSTEEQEGLLFAFKIPTSTVWERLIGEAVDSTGSFKADRQIASRALFETTHGGKGTRGKSVDIGVLRAGAESQSPALLLDAKYKAAKSSLLQSSMNDQYQIYAYANLWEAPAFLVYPTREADTPKLRISQAKKNLGRIAGVLHLPFPKPGQSSIPEKPSVLESVLERALRPPGTYSPLQRAWPSAGGQPRVQRRKLA